MDSNQKNFISFNSGFRDYPFSMEAVDDGPVAYLSGDYKDVSVLSNDAITYPVADVEIISYNGTGKLPKWTGTAIRLFKPDSFTGTALLQYRVKDILGRYSNIASVYINFTARTVSFVAYEPSAYCVKTAYDQNTGMKAYAQRVQKYDDNNTLVLPYHIEDNTAGPDFISAVSDPGACPVPSQLFVPVTIYNSGTYAIINQVTLKKTGNPDIVVPVNVPVYPGSGSSIKRAFPIPLQSYNDVIFRYQQNIADLSAKNYAYGASMPYTGRTFPHGVISTNQNLSIGAIVPSVDGIYFEMLA